MMNDIAYKTYQAAVDIARETFKKAREKIARKANNDYTRTELISSEAYNEVREARYEATEAYFAALKEAYDKDGRNDDE